MEVEWDWNIRNPKKFKNKNEKIKKEGKSYELWRIWWSICTTMFKRKIK